MMTLRDLAMERSVPLKLVFRFHDWTWAAILEYQAAPSHPQPQDVPFGRNDEDRWTPCPHRDAVRHRGGARLGGRIRGGQTRGGDRLCPGRPRLSPVLLVRARADGAGAAPWGREARRGRLGTRTNPYDPVRPAPGHARLFRLHAVAAWPRHDHPAGLRGGVRPHP